MTTAASIWGSSAIGILVGVGFYVAAIGLTALFLVSMKLVPWLERLLPAHATIAATLHYRESHVPQTEVIHRYLEERGLSIPADSLSIHFDNGRFEVQCLILANTVALMDLLTRTSDELSKLPCIERFTIAQSSRG